MYKTSRRIDFLRGNDELGYDQVSVSKNAINILILRVKGFLDYGNVGLLFKNLHMMWNLEYLLHSVFKNKRESGPNYCI